MVPPWGQVLGVSPASGQDLSIKRSNSMLKYLSLFMDFSCIAQFLRQNTSIKRCLRKRSEKHLKAELGEADSRGCLDEEIFRITCLAAISVTAGGRNYVRQGSLLLIFSCCSADFIDALEVIFFAWCHRVPLFFAHSSISKKFTKIGSRWISVWEAKDEYRSINREQYGKEGQMQGQN